MLRILLAFTFLMVSAASASAQAEDQSGRAQRGRAARGAVSGPLSPGEVVNILDAYAVVQAQEALRLTDTQYAQFVGRLKKLQQGRRQAQQARNKIIQELRQLSAPEITQSDETAIRSAIRALREHDERTAADLRKASDVLDEVLDLRQQARFRVFEEQLERRKLDLLLRAREGAARRQNR